MIVQCPNCTTKFKFPDDKVKPGVKVRCSKCKNVFELKLDAASAPGAPEPAPAAPPPVATTGVDESADKFNFGDDFAFGEEKPASTERKPAAPPVKKTEIAAPDFSLDDEKPARPAPPPPPRKPVRTRACAGQGGKRRISVLKTRLIFPAKNSAPRPRPRVEDDLGFSAEMPEIPGDKEEAPSEEVGMEDGIDNFKIDRGEEIPAKSKEKETDSEEFHFSNKLESYARTDTIKARPDSSDDLEAKLDTETDSAPTHARRVHRAGA